MLVATPRRLSTRPSRRPAHSTPQRPTALPPPQRQPLPLTVRTPVCLTSLTCYPPVDTDELNFQNPSGMNGDVQVKQPKLLTCTLKDYQLKGLNWLANLYEQGINGILADEMVRFCLCSVADEDRGSARRCRASHSWRTSPRCTISGARSSSSRPLRRCTTGSRKSPDSSRDSRRCRTGATPRTAPSSASSGIARALATTGTRRSTSSSLRTNSYGSRLS